MRPVEQNDFLNKSNFESQRVFDIGPGLQLHKCFVYQTTTHLK